jgi:hypothetical protein
MGLQQGERFRDEIHRSLETLASLEAVRLMKPRWLPLGVFLRAAERKAERFVRDAFATVSVIAEPRLRGMADGARVPLRKLALCSAMEAVLSDLGPVTTAPLASGCSALAATGTATADGHPILAHNFDYLPDVQPYYFIRRSSPHERLRSVELAIMPLPGAVDGVNEAGLAISCNYAYAVDKSAIAPTITMLIAEALANLRTVDEAIAFFQRTPRTGGGLLMLGDADGRIAAIDISPTRVAVRTPERDRLFHTNRYCSAVMCEVEIPSVATYGDRSPTPLRGRRVHQSSESRDARFQSLLANESPLTADSVHAVMSDHGGDGVPSADTICMHGNYWHTTAALQLLPDERLLRAAFSPACAARFTDFPAA